jgi:hypothetical protein
MAIRALTTPGPNKVLIGIDHIIPYGSKWVIFYRTRAGGRLKRVTRRLVVVNQLDNGYLVFDSRMVVSLEDN